MRRRPALLLLLLVAGLGVPASGAAATAGDQQRALRQLALLRTAAPASLHGYSATLFRRWLDPDRNGCDAREDALRRAGTHVRRGPGCTIRSGSWLDAYSGKTYRTPRLIAVDHVVPLVNAWRSGARRWTSARRQRFANDPVVLAVTSASLDRQKGNRSPDRWKPPRRAAWFHYAERWIQVKTKYRLTVTPAERAALRAMLDLAPANVAAPGVAGATRVGATLTATVGTWSGSPTLQRQWQRCSAAGCTNIGGQSGASYLLVAADAGERVRVVVTATNHVGSSVAPSPQTVTISGPPANSVQPVVAGTPSVGSTLTAADGAWSGSPPPTITRQWQRCAPTCVNLVPAVTGTTYKLVSADAGKTVRVVVTATNIVGTASASSLQTAPIIVPAPSPVLPVNLSSPTISGTARVGSRLTAGSGTWSGVPTPTLTRRWQRCGAADCIDIAGATATTYVLDAADAGQRLRVVVRATNAVASVEAPSAQTAPVAAATGDPTIATAGDIACDPLNGNFNGGAGTGAACAQLAVSNLMFNRGFASVLPLGDNQYYCGGLSDYQQSYGLSWGRLLSITHPVVGNHEYVTTGGTGCDTSANAGGYFSYFGARAGSPGQGYYSYDVGTWHLIALNSNCGNVGGCGPTSPQGSWLAADLAAHRNACTLAYWHIPLFSSGGRAATNAQPLWTALYNARADVILNGHDHIYERFAPQAPDGIRNDAQGLRQFIVGTGGANHTSLATVAANSEVRNTDTFGILKLTLHATSYDWQFVPAPGTGAFSDSGSQACH